MTFPFIDYVINDMMQSYFGIIVIHFRIYSPMHEAIITVCYISNNDINEIAINNETHLGDIFSV